MDRGKPEGNLQAHRKRRSLSTRRNARSDGTLSALLYTILTRNEPGKTMATRARLTKTAVVQAAAELINEEGTDALSLNRLAEKLDIRTPSLYNHVDGLPGLQRELAVMNARQLADRLSSAAIGKSGTELFLVVAQAFRSYVKEYPGLYMSTLRSSGKQEIRDENLVREEERALKIGLAVMASLGMQ